MLSDSRLAIPIYIREKPVYNLQYWEGPVPRYTAQQGDCISSIAHDYGFFPDTIWNHPENAGLKDKRKDPNILFPGDEVFVPEKDLRIESRGTGARHRFVRKGVPEFLSLRFLNEEDPRAGENYVLEVDGNTVSGKLDADGACLLAIPPGARQARLTLGDPSRGEIYNLSLGHLNPIEEISGVEGRLFNLGYLKTAPTGAESPELAEAVRTFQEDQKLSTGNGLDQATRQKLVEVHGS